MRTGGRSPRQLDQGSADDHLRPLRDGGQGQPMDFLAAPADEALPGNQREGSARKNMKEGNLNLVISLPFDRIPLKSSSRKI